MWVANGDPLGLQRAHQYSSVVMLDYAQMRINWYDFRSATGPSFNQY